MLGNEGDGGDGVVSDMPVVIGLVDWWEWESTNMSSSSSLLDPSSVKGGGEGGILILLFRARCPVPCYAISWLG